MLWFGEFISRCRIFGRIVIEQYFSSNFKIWKSILNFLPMVKVSKFPLPSIDALTRNPIIRIYMAPNVWRDTPPWTRIVPKRYKALLGCRQLQEAGVFYNFKNGFSFMTSKISSKNLSNSR